MDDTMCRLTFRSNIFDLSNETRQPASHGNCFIHEYTDTEQPIQFSLYVIIQRLE